MLENYLKNHWVESVFKQILFESIIFALFDGVKTEIMWCLEANVCAIR